MTEKQDAISLVKIGVKDLLCFFDEKPDGSEGHATGIVGEDLNTACFQHYLKSRGARVSVLKAPKSNKPHRVNRGNGKGPWLDRWIEVDWPCGAKTVFQTEIKNWSAHAIGGKKLSVSASSEEITKYKQTRWEGHWVVQRHASREAITAKVLVRMKPPNGVDEEIIRPLLIFWEALGPQDQADSHLFRINAPTCDFPFELPGKWPDPHESPDLWMFSELWVFSVSSYLRSIQNTSIELDMPNAAARLQILNRLFPTGA